MFPNNQHICLIISVHGHQNPVGKAIAGKVGKINIRWKRKCFECFVVLKIAVRDPGVIFRSISLTIIQGILSHCDWTSCSRRFGPPETLEILWWLRGRLVRWPLESFTLKSLTEKSAREQVWWNRDVKHVKGNSRGCRIGRVHKELSSCVG